MNRKISGIIGWYGVIAILVAYGLNILEVINVESIYYIVLNLTGSASIVINAWFKRDNPIVFLNIVWAAIAIVALIRLFL